MSASSLSLSITVSFPITVSRARCSSRPIPREHPLLRPERIAAALTDVKQERGGRCVLIPHAIPHACIHHIHTLPLIRWFINTLTHLHVHSKLNSVRYENKAASSTVSDVHIYVIVCKSSIFNIYRILLRLWEIRTYLHSNFRCWGARKRSW
jgi:hypothetical protein